MAAAIGIQQDQIVLLVGAMQQHATVAGACTTILKAWFQEDHVLPNPVVPNTDGTQLVPWTGEPLTVGGELNKVAANVGIARNGAGVHWLSDYYQSLRLGEYVAKTLLDGLIATGKGGELAVLAAGQGDAGALADAIVGSWYSGVYESADGPAVVTFDQALVWNALTFTKPFAIDDLLRALADHTDATS